MNKQKQINELRDEIKHLEWAVSTTKEFLDKFGECEVCGGLFNKNKMKEVKIENYYGAIYERYCKEHEPKYNKKVLRLDGSGKAKYYTNEEREVDENGKIIKQK